MTDKLDIKFPEADDADDARLPVRRKKKEERVFVEGDDYWPGLSEVAFALYERGETELCNEMISIISSTVQMRQE